MLRQYRTIPALRLKHRSGSCGTASALPKCSIMSGCGTRIVLRGQKPLALCDRCPCFGSLFPPLAALTFAASSIICAFGLASAAPRSPYRHLELCGIAPKNKSPAGQSTLQHRPAGDCYAMLRQHRTIPALRLKHRSGGCGTASALPKCSIMSGCGTRIVLRGQKPLALCDRCPCFGSLFPPLATLTFAASSIICAFGLASAAPRSPYRHLELCGIALNCLA